MRFLLLEVCKYAKARILQEDISFSGCHQAKRFSNLSPDIVVRIDYVCVCVYFYNDWDL